jgi:hypothetical protein
MRLKSPFEASFGTVQDRRVLLVEVVADGAIGRGEVTALETPGYNSETTDTAWYMISEFIAPALINQNLSAASEFAPLMSTIRGHEMAKRSLGLGSFPNREFMNQLVSLMGLHLSPFAFTILYVLLAGNFGLVKSTAPALGEEIGWRASWSRNFSRASDSLAQP